MRFYTHLLTPEDHELARARVAPEALNKYSYLGPEGHLKGALGEIGFERWLEHFATTFTYINTTKYDYDVHGAVGTIKIDVKTKARNYFARADFEGSIPDYVAGFQQYDFAVFINLVASGPGAGYSHVQICGFADGSTMTTKGYPQVANKDNFGIAGNLCKFDCHNIKFRDLVDPTVWANLYL